MKAAQTLTGDPALALHYGEAVQISEVSVVGLLGQASETMFEAFAQLNRFVRLIVETDNGGHPDRFRFALERGGMWLVDNRRGAGAFPELTESAFAPVGHQRAAGQRPAGGQGRARHLSRSRIRGRVRTHLPGAGGVRQRLERDADRPEAARRAGGHGCPRYVFGVLSEHAEALLKSLESASTVRGRVESLLMPILHTGEVGIDRIAGKMGLSRQTLFRRLRAEGVTFAGVLDDLRHRLALHYLEGRKVSLNESAYLVGFSDPAAFSRAFKRWTGMSPKAARGVRTPPADAGPRGGSGGGR